MLRTINAWMMERAANWRIGRALGYSGTATLGRIGNRLDGGSCRAKRLSAVAALVAVGCGGYVDLGHSMPTGTPPAVTDESELNAQTTNLVALDVTGVSSIALDGEFLYFGSWRAGASENKLWRCQKSNCLATLSVIANEVYAEALQLNANQLGWPLDDGNKSSLEICDIPDCKNRHLAAAKFDFWEEDAGYWFEWSSASIYRCSLPDCAAGKTALASSLPIRRNAPVGHAVPRDFTVAEGQLYWSLEETIMRVGKDGQKAPERLTLGPSTEWTGSPSSADFESDVTVLDMEMDGPYIYAALQLGNQNANTTLGCDTCKPGVAIARWRYSEDGRAREWVLSNDPALTRLVHLRVFGGELVWGTITGELWSCVADRCSDSKRQIGVEDASSSFPRTWGFEFDSLAMDESAIFWLAVPCQPVVLDCSLTGPVWTLKRTPRLPR